MATVYFVTENYIKQTTALTKNADGTSGNDDTVSVDNVACGGIDRDGSGEDYVAERAAGIGADNAALSGSQGRLKRQRGESACNGRGCA